MDPSIMLLTLKSSAKLNNGVEIPYLGLGVYQSPPGEITLRAVRHSAITSRQSSFAAKYLIFL